MRIINTPATKHLNLSFRRKPESIDRTGCRIKSGMTYFDMFNCRSDKRVVLAIMLIFLFPLVLPAARAELPKMDRDREEATIKKGEMLFLSTCQSCHSLKYLTQKAKMAPEDTQRMFGKVPPDLSLMAKVRGGSGYIYELLVGFNDTPQKNSVFPNIAMPPPFPKDDPLLSQKAKDIAAFLKYAAEPSERERRSLGSYVLGYMVLLTALLYALNRMQWQRIRKKPVPKS
jgi:hypothetical protein